MLSAFLWKHQTVQNKRLSSKFGSRPNLASMVSSADSSESLLSELCCTSTARILMIPLFFLQMYAHQAFYPMLKINMKMRILIGYLSSIFFFFERQLAGIVIILCFSLTLDNEERGWRHTTNILWSPFKILNICKIPFFYCGPSALMARSPFTFLFPHNAFSLNERHGGEMVLLRLRSL